MRNIHFYITDDGKFSIAEFLDSLSSKQALKVGDNIFRLLGFFEEDNLVVLNRGFQKKTQKNTNKRHQECRKSSSRLFSEEET